jgi:NDP-sugar pyrophosphorylase family protein
MIPALVLTAGLATRLRPLSRVRAKAALPVAGTPLVERIVRWLAAAEVSEFVLNLHYLPETITSLLDDGRRLGLRVSYSFEETVLGSAGGPRHALPLLCGEEFLIVNGDTLTDINLPGAVAAHRASGAMVTMVLIPNEEPQKYGGVLVDREGVITGFTRRGASEPSYHFVGVQVAQKAAFASLPDLTPYESVAALYPELMRTQPGSVRGYIAAGEFHDIGTPTDYLQTSLRLGSREGRQSVLAGARSRIDTSAQLRDSVLWDDVDVAAGVRVTRSVITDGVHLPAGTEWTDSTVRVPVGALEPNEVLRHGLAVAPLNRTAS